MSSPKYIQFYNVFGHEHSNFHLSVEELYLHGLLQILRNREFMTITNIEVIEQYSPVKFRSRAKEDRKRIYECLCSLRDKKVIRFEEDIVNVDKNGKESLDYKTLLFISINTDLIDMSIGDKGLKGFENIEMNKFRSFDSMIDFYLYFIVKRFDEIGKFKCAISRWAKILKCSEKTVQKKLDEVIKKKWIYVSSGDYKDEQVNGRKIQDTNKYSTVPFTEDEKSNRTKKQEATKLNEFKEKIKGASTTVPFNEENERSYPNPFDEMPF